MNMLDAISDFWKPAKKNQPPEKLNPNELQVGTGIGFGFVPQASLSGRRLQITGINTYKFGDEALTSFVLAPEKDLNSSVQVSMIVAEADGENYLAISRRMTINDRMKMFESHDLDNVLSKPDVAVLPCKDSIADFKGWTVASYKREMQGMKGYIYKGDFRKNPLPDVSQAQEFSYTLLVSDNNEHAIEIEKYQDGRIEVYTTIYRRVSDIGEVTQPTRADMMSRPDLKLASPQPADEKPAAPVVEQPKVAQPEKADKKPAAATVAADQPVKSEPVKLQEFPQAQVAQPTRDDKPKTVVQAAEAVKPPAQPATPQTLEEKKPMASNETVMNGSLNEKTPTIARMSTESHKQELKAVNKIANGLDNESIECELRVANRIIDEAIRSEMRLSDVVRRIIELPVSHQEAVQLPITLSDEDYSLLAIRYGVSPSDRNAIKSRIIEDLGSFSGKKIA